MKHRELRLPRYRKRYRTPSLRGPFSGAGRATVPATTDPRPGSPFHVWDVVNADDYPLRRRTTYTPDRLFQAPGVHGQGEQEDIRWSITGSKWQLPVID
jgi:hypothetical protein